MIARSPDRGTRARGRYAARGDARRAVPAPPPAPPAAGAHPSRARPRAGGKFLFAAGEKLLVRGVTYGEFHPGRGGGGFVEETAERDFARMAESGVNAVRTYGVPPRWLLDRAARHGLRLMVGLPWEQHVTFLDDRGRARGIVERVAAGVRACAGHPAVLCYAIGNEIPAGVVRWHGRRRIERFIERLYRAAKAEDPDGLVTYVNYPSTEYLELPFADLACFNVYLEDQERFDAYLARLHSIAGDRPLLMAEIGLDSRRNGKVAQARALGWQVRTAFAAGCAGAFVFAWTDEWHRGGHDIEDWDFGLVTRDRRPKPALGAVRAAFREAPFPRRPPRPRISVVVCSCNGARTIRDCLEGLKRLEYPDFEVIVVDDGSTDATAEIARGYGFRLIRTENRGLSSARNAGMESASGEIVAYIDDDARPDPHWLSYLAATFARGEVAGAGGPNIAPAGDGWIADCVANAPGGPLHVLLSDRDAEHVPGCNMAFRRTFLESVGGFDPRFRAAGDDVDMCWRLLERGWTIGFSPAAMVWHHRRDSLRAYWRQQVGYGKAEALLEAKWPQRYNAAGHLSWAGRIYGKGLALPLGLRPARIYHGRWGSAPFQALYRPPASLLGALPLMPEWYLVLLALAALSGLGLLWRPLLIFLPLAAIAAGASVAQAVAGAARARPTAEPRSARERLRFRSLTAFLHLIQPLARLTGRMRHGLTPWRRGAGSALAVPLPSAAAVWSERWRAPDERIRAMAQAIRAAGALSIAGGDFDDWDLEIRGGWLGGARARVVVEEHGAGRQLVRVRVWPRVSRAGLAAVLALAALSVGAARQQAWIAFAILGGTALVLAGTMLKSCSSAHGAMAGAVRGARAVEGG